MNKNITPKLVLLDSKGQLKIIHVLSPYARTTRQARKYKEKTKTTKTHNMYSSNHWRKERRRRGRREEGGS
jgi:hypothetical protein